MGSRNAGRARRDSRQRTGRSGQEGQEPAGTGRSGQERAAAATRLSPPAHPDALSPSSTSDRTDSFRCENIFLSLLENPSPP